MRTCLWTCRHGLCGPRGATQSLVLVGIRPLPRAFTAASRAQFPRRCSHYHHFPSGSPGWSRARPGPWPPVLLALSFPVGFLPLAPEGVLRPVPSLSKDPMYAVGPLSAGNRPPTCLSAPSFLFLVGAWTPRFVRGAPCRKEGPRASQALRGPDPQAFFCAAEAAAAFPAHSSWSLGGGWGMWTELDLSAFSPSDQQVQDAASGR